MENFDQYFSMVIRFGNYPNRQRFENILKIHGWSVGAEPIDPDYYPHYIKLSRLHGPNNSDPDIPVGTDATIFNVPPTKTAVASAGILVSLYKQRSQPNRYERHRLY